MPVPVLVTGAIAWLVGAFMNALREYLPGIVGRVMIALGIGLVAHQIAMPALLAMVQDKLSGMPALFIAYFTALGIDVVITVILSARAAVSAQKLMLGRMSQT